MGNIEPTALTTVEAKPDTRLMGVAAIDSDLYVPGMESLTREDVSLPRLVLVQLTSQNLPADSLAHFGEWYNTVTGEYAANVYGILLGIAKQRAAFPREFSGDSKAQCASDEALYPRSEFVGTTVTDSKTGVVHVIDGTCADCPFSKFAGSVTPMCTFSYSYGFYDTNSGLPFVMRAQRTGIKAAKQLNMQIMKYGRLHVIVLSAVKVADANGKYAVPVFSAGDKITPDLANGAAEFVRTFGNIAERVTADEPDVPNVGSDDDMPPAPPEDIPF